MRTPVPPQKSFLDDSGRLNRLANPRTSIFTYAEAIKKLAELEMNALFPGHGVFCPENGGSHVRTAAEKFASGLIPPQLYHFA